MNVESFLNREIPEVPVVSEETPVPLESADLAIDTKTPTIALCDAAIPSYTVRLFEGKLVMTLPKVLQPNDPVTDQLKHKPDLTLTDRNGAVKLIMTHLYQKATNDSEVFEYQTQIQHALKKLNPSMEWLLGGVKEVHGLQIPFFECITTNLGVESFNLSFFLRMQHRVLRGKFMCPDQTVKNWRPIFHQVLESVEVIEDKKGRAFRFFGKQQKDFQSIPQ